MNRCLICNFAFAQLHNVRWFVCVLAVSLLLGNTAIGKKPTDKSVMPECAPLDSSHDFPKNRFELGKPGQFSMETIVGKFAPTLWFSPDEPINGPLPQNFPTDKRACADGKGKCGIAYYRPIRIAAECNNDKGCESSMAMIVNRGVWTDALPEEVSSRLRFIDLKYYFYYPEEVGFGRHTHDFENMVITVGLCVDGESETGEANNDVVYAQAIKAAGGAHGVGWYLNELDMTRTEGDPTLDVLVPPIVLVEEGKHASAIDRNGDGFWTPGYDANVHPHDAWGIRDTLRSPSFLANAYHAEVTKHRLPDSVVFPSPNEIAVRPPEWGNKGPTLTGSQQTYRLRPATNVVCDGISQYVHSPSNNKKEKVSKSTLRELTDPDQQMCRNNRVRPSAEKTNAKELPLVSEWGHLRNFMVRTPGGAFYRVPWYRRTDPWEWVSYRYDQAPGLAIITPIGLSLPMGWFAVKANAIWRQQPIVENPSSTTPLDSGSLDRSARWGFEGMFVPSASRSFDYYVSSGVEQDPSNRWDSALEAGLRIRATIFNWIPNHSIKRYLGGFRIGIRANNIFNSTESFKNIHLVFEAGGGSW